jgi:TPR repeat protein
MKEKEQIIIQKKEETKRHDEETLKAEKLKEQEQEVKELVRKGKECYNNNGYEAAFKYFKQASEYSDPEAQYELGLCFFEGKGVNCDINEAIKMWKLSAEQGFVIAQYRLGMEIPDEFLEDDEKVKEGMKWLEMAAKQGYSEAQWQLSNFYATDWLPVYDPLLASQWMKAAAEQGHAEAIEALKFRG